MHSAVTLRERLEEHHIAHITTYSDLLKDLAVDFRHAQIAFPVCFDACKLVPTSQVAGFKALLFESPVHETDHKTISNKTVSQPPAGVDMAIELFSLFF